ncbi:MAG: type III pantothenate kinase [Rugosibacter sp.]|nr:type III pantothenate kinase [Rugosibacter sp.]
MMLCLDAGNTRLKYGLRDGMTWLVQGAIAYADLDQLALRLPAAPERIIACNVAGAQVAERIEHFAERLSRPLEWFVSSAACAGVVNGYQQPAQLGADRWAALVGARTLQPGAVLVVMAGTATTIDLLDEQGVFRGGLILPGLSLMRQALARNTAALPAASGHFSMLPTNTDDAIVSGALDATLGAIERMARRFVNVSAAPAVRYPQTVPGNFCCLLSGGAAVELLPRFDLPVRPIEYLVLEGLARVAWPAASAC